MAILTLEELKARHPNGNFKQVRSLDDIKRESSVTQQTAGDTFEKKEPTSFLGKARDFATGVIGGGKLAEGAGLALAAPGVQEQQEADFRQFSDIALALQKAIGQNMREGKPTDRLEKAYLDQVAQMDISEDQRQDFIDALPTDAEVVGSAVRLGGTLVAPTIAGKAAKATTLGRGITGVGGGIVRGATAGAVGGGIEGGIQGAGLGIEKQEGELSDVDLGEVGKSAAAGAAAGGATGGVVGGAVGGVQGVLAGKEQRLLDSVTPSPKELGKKGFEDALRRGEITPATATQPAKFKLGDSQRETALKFKGLIDDNPVKTSIGITDKIATLDDEVGTFLKKNNSIFNKGELRNSLVASMDDIDDLSIGEARMAKAKQKLVDSFMERVEKGDMESLWKQRKLFDADIEKAFTGSPSAQKSMKIGLRNAVQDFIAEGTPDELYKGFMGDMSNLYRLQETVSTKAFGQKDLSLIRKWMRNNPLKTKLVGGAVVLGVGGSFVPSSGASQ